MRGIAVVAIALLLSGCAKVEPFDPVPAPQWQAGDSFAYTLQTWSESTVKVTQDGKPAPPQRESHPTGPEPAWAFQVLSTQLDGAPLFIAVNQALAEDAEIVTDRLIAFAPTDLEPRAAVVAGDTIHVSPGMHPPLQFPLTQGATWSYDMENLAEDDEVFGDMVITAKVQRMETLETAFGDIDAVRIQHTAAFPDMASNLAALNQHAKQQGLDGEIVFEGGIVGTIHYAPSLQQVVQETWEGRLLMRIVDNGADAVVEVSGSSKLTLALTIADQDPEMPDMDVEQIAAFLAGGGGPNVGELITTPAPYVIDIQQSAQRVNAADGAMVSLTATGAPEEDLLFWSVDNGGNVVASGHGTEFSFTPESGIHTVTVTSSRDDDPITSATTTVVGDWIGTLAWDCPTATTTVASKCDDATLDLADGWSGFEATFDAGATAASGTFSIRDMRGNEVTASTEDPTITDSGALTGQGMAFTFEGTSLNAAPDVALSVTYDAPSEQSEAPSLQAWSGLWDLVNGALHEHGLA